MPRIPREEKIVKPKEGDEAENQLPTEVVEVAIDLPLINRKLNYIIGLLESQASQQN